MSAYSLHYNIYSSVWLNNYRYAQLSCNETTYYTITDLHNPYKIKTTKISVFPDVTQQLQII